MSGPPPPTEPTEFVDRVGPLKARHIVIVAVQAHCADVQREVWRRRRERLLRYLDILEHHVDYDLAVYRARLSQQCWR